MSLLGQIFKREWCVLLFFLQTNQVSAQDTSHTLNPVTIEMVRADARVSQIETTAPSYLLSNKKIEFLGVRDVGGALKVIPGSLIKDYGGIGGVKTISYRSLGSSHTGVLLDGNSQQNTQVGTINLSQFESFGLKEVLFTSGQPQVYLAMASAYIPANTIQINSKLMSFDTTFNAELYQNVTSINSYESGAIVKVPLGNKVFVGTQLFSKYGSGEYDFNYDLSGSNVKLSRINSQIFNYKGRIGMGYKFKNGMLRGSFYFNNNQQELPGAVILYNPSNDQKLYNEDYRGDINVMSIKNSWTIKSHGFVQSNYLRYFDPTYFNSQGFWSSSYLNQILGAGIMSSVKLSKLSARLYFGSDVYYSQLKSSEFNNQPFRAGANSVVAMKINFPKLIIEANVNHQLIHDQARSADTTVLKNYSKLSPFIGLKLLPFDNVKFGIRSSYKRVFRMPTFNDLYYNFLGNTNLLPEDAHLINYGLSHEFDLKNYNILELSVDGFYNAVKNKIIAIPTKDIFNWSMQNLGKTKAVGLDLAMLYAQEIKDFKWSVSASLTINHSVDITDSTSSSYGHQLPYTPLLVSNFGANFSWKGWMISNNLIYTGERYSLNENIAINHLDPFFDWNVGLSKEFEFGTAYKLFVSAKVMNVLGNNYEVVRSFPMPGRYYQCTLKFKYK
ncbi:TonB-dependent receptor plug domain-containing protein [Paracrocinitomix mangrovi]|uniref:TonB-dependent receptor plug domain-containing protein n=1 Tax=Paracrocinitomix mangrovi TaxID=2862509 RepID=UPI001C8D5684|nr:TonB-dependent receptor plug domain-containing protein [Paracrocinitomix mangrovi]UKN03550.1 TonB-dependent receptor plug domain-containing protein [Paracrocinitomix mangrovi]